MTNKIGYLKKEIWHKEKLIEFSNKAAEECKHHESLMMLFVNQAERLEERLEKLKVELKNERKLLKGKANVKISKKRGRSRR